LCETVPYPDRTFVFRVETVVGGNDFTIFFLKSFVGFFTRQIFCSEDDIVELITFIINGLQSRERNKGNTALVALVFI